VITSLISQGLPSARAHAEAASISQSQGGGVASIPHFVRLDFAYATRSVLYVMAAIMATAAIVAFVGLRAGLQEEPGTASEDDRQALVGASQETFDGTLPDATNP
jgi:hypothetical protein